MPDVPIDFPGDKHTSWLSIVGEYQPGDQPPAGYLDRGEWALVQLEAGLGQTTCPACRLFKFPQELSAMDIHHERICNDCLPKVLAATLGVKENG